MFCHITANWHERPLVSRQLVVNRIGNTTTDSGLRIRAALDENAYSSGIKLSEEELAFGLCRTFRYITVLPQYKRHTRRNNGYRQDSHLESSHRTGPERSAVAEQEHRSIANMVEVMIREYCGRNSVVLPEQPAPVSSNQSRLANETKSPRTKKDA